VEAIQLRFWIDLKRRFTVVAVMQIFDHHIMSKATCALAVTTARIAAAYEHDACGLLDRS
jgi:hypothetical protein